MTQRNGCFFVEFSRSIIMEMNVSVSSTINGLCQLKLIFPNTEFIVLTTPNNGDIDNAWTIELSLAARWIIYVVILGIVTGLVSLILKLCLGECQRPGYTDEVTMNEAEPLMSEKSTGVTYGTNQEDVELGKSSSSEDLYDGKICVICYDGPRNSFFVPCGHCATCYECAQRIMEVENKVCPICRRLIHRVKKLISS